MLLNILNKFWVKKLIRKILGRSTRKYKNKNIFRTENNSVRRALAISCIWRVKELMTENDCRFVKQDDWEVQVMLKWLRNLEHGTDQDQNVRPQLLHLECSALSDCFVVSEDRTLTLVWAGCYLFYLQKVKINIRDWSSVLKIIKSIVRDKKIHRRKWEHNKK